LYECTLPHYHPSTKMNNNDLSNTPVHFLAVWLQQQLKASTPPTWKGGWERWAQGQVALFMDNTDGYAVWTEEKIYKDHPADACDLDFARGNVHTFCELKCYSATNEDTPNDFLNEVEKDFVQVQLPLVAPAKGSTMWVVALSQMQFRDAIQAEGMKPKHAFWTNFEYVSVKAPGSMPSTSTFDIWYWSYVNNK
jgi:hypothetical protein